MLGAPWQTGLLPSPSGRPSGPGPCATRPTLALAELARMGFAGAFVSTRTDHEGFLELPALRRCRSASWSRAPQPVEQPDEQMQITLRDRGIAACGAQLLFIGR